MDAVPPSSQSDSPLLQSSIQWTVAMAVLLGFMVIGISVWRLSPQPISEAERGLGPPLLCLDLNRAEDYELSLLPSVGPVLARRIVLDRQAHGDFRSLGDLRRVPGIGPKTIAEIGGYCCVTPSRAAPASAGEPP
ncbi:MAG: ComEA family DNA-binding protein [Novipirellula sp. JB048]